MDINNIKNTNLQANPTTQNSSANQVNPQANQNTSTNIQNNPTVNVQDNVNLNNTNKPEIINTSLNPQEINNQVSQLSSMIGNPFTQNPFYQNPMTYNNPYLINTANYDPNITNVNSVNNSGSLWKYLLAGGLGFLTGAALSSLMFYSYPLYYPMYYSYYYSPCWYNFYPYMWWCW
jgi:hypothetical protein